MSGTWGGRAVYSLALMLVVAGLTHLSTVLLMPDRSPSSVYAMLAKAVNQQSLTTWAAPDATGVFTDPAFPHAACLYDLRGGAVSASLAVADGQFAALSVHDRHGRVLAGLTSRSARNGRLGLTVTSPLSDQARRSGETGSPGGLADIRVEASEPLGFVLAEVLAEAPSEQNSAAAAAAALSCRPAVP